MDEVVVTIAAGRDRPEDISALRADLNEHVGPTTFAESRGVDGQKGLAVDATTLVITLLGTPAVAALINVLKSYFESNRVTELDLSTARGNVKLRLPPGSRLSADDIRRALDSVLDPA